MAIFDLIRPAHQSLAGSLAPGEEVILQDKPAFGEFLVLGFGTFVQLGLFLLVFVALLVKGHRTAALLAFVVADILAIRLVARRLTEYYTSYVITDLRIMRLSGVFSRVTYSIPLGKITDIAYRQTWWERVLNYATIEIDSASEKSGLDKLRGLQNAERFNRVLLAMVADKQGFVVPGTAALNRRRAREDHIKLNLRFGVPVSDLFSAPDDRELEFASKGIERDLLERDERVNRATVMRHMSDNLPPSDGAGADGAGGSRGGDYDDYNDIGPDDDDDDLDD